MPLIFINPANQLTCSGHYYSHPIQYTSPPYTNQSSSHKSTNKYSPFKHMTNTHVLPYPILVIQNRQTFNNTRDGFLLNTFIDIHDTMTQFKAHFQKLQAYKQDTLRFMTKVQVQDSNKPSRISIVPYPLHANQQALTFLLVLHWHPNCPRNDKKTRKGSFVTQKQIISRSHQQVNRGNHQVNRGNQQGNRVVNQRERNTRVGNDNQTYNDNTNDKYKQEKLKIAKNMIQSQDLLSLVFLLSEKIYVPQQHIDQFVQVISNRHQTHPSHFNCLTIVVASPSAQKDLLLSTRIPSEGTSQYHVYQYQHYPPQYHERPIDIQGLHNYSQRTNKYSQGQLQMGSVRSPRISMANSSLNRKHSKKSNGDKTPRRSRRSRMLEFKEGSRSKTESDFNQGQSRRVLGFHADRAKQCFSSIEYLRVADELQVDTVIFHLNQHKNTHSDGIRLSTLESIVCQWPKYASYELVQQLNRQLVLQGLRKQCLQNYRSLMQLQFQQLAPASIEEIYTTLHQIHNHALSHYLQGSVQFMNHQEHNNNLQRIQKELSLLQGQVVSNHAYSKRQQGRRMMTNLQLKQSDNKHQAKHKKNRLQARQEGNKLQMMQLKNKQSKYSQNKQLKQLENITHLRISQSRGEKQHFLNKSDNRKARQKRQESVGIMRVVGVQQLATMDIGFRLYKELILPTLPRGFQQMGRNRNKLKAHNQRMTGNNQEDMLNQIQNRIEICQQKKKMLATAIDLSVRQQETLQYFVRDLASTQRSDTQHQAQILPQL